LGRTHSVHDASRRKRAELIECLLVQRRTAGQDQSQGPQAVRHQPVTDLTKAAKCGRKYPEYCHFVLPAYVSERQHIAASDRIGNNSRCPAHHLGNQAVAKSGWSRVLSERKVYVVTYHLAPARGYLGAIDKGSIALERTFRDARGSRGEGD